MKAIFVIVVSVLLMSCATVEVAERQDSCNKYQRPSGFCMR
jgi:hypothetical protein